MEGLAAFDDLVGKVMNLVDEIFLKNSQKLESFSCFQLFDFLKLLRRGSISRGRFSKKKRVRQFLGIEV
jgi:hypothetical protein